MGQPSETNLENVEEILDDEDAVTEDNTDEEE